MEKAIEFKSEQVTEMSEVASLQAEVLDLGLVRESRPVFIYDRAQAKKKNGDAVRQERRREKLAGQGIALRPVPVEIYEKVRDEFGGNWALFVEKIAAKQEVFQQEKGSGLAGVDACGELELLRSIVGRTDARARLARWLLRI